MRICPHRILIEVGLNGIEKSANVEQDLLGHWQSAVYEIGGPDQVTYCEWVRGYARQRGLRRLMIAVPVLTPRLSSLWLGLVAPLYARIGRNLIDSIRPPTVVQDDTAFRVFSVRPLGADVLVSGVHLAQARLCWNFAQHWTCCGPSLGDIMKNWNPIWMLMLSVAVCFVAAGAGAVFTSGSVSTWYPALLKPSWNPPAWIFGPVWTVLYLMMAVAAWLIWRRRGFDGGAGALWLFALQLALNALWSPLFFGLRNPLAGLVDIVPLWAAILATLVSFWRISPLAGALLMPYWLWVSFATALNFTIWRMNR